MSGNDKEKVTLAKALNIKNRLAAVLKRLGNEIKENNSVPKGGVRKIDVAEAVRERGRVMEILIDVKETIYKANLPIQREVFRLAELKSEFSMWEDVSCDQGKVILPRDSYSSRNELVVDMTALLTHAEIRSVQAKIADEMDAIQDELDKHNHKTMVEIDAGYREFAV